MPAIETETPKRDVPRWVELIPPVVVLGAFGFLAITKFNVVESSVKSGRAILVIAAIVAGWLLLSRVVLPRVFHPIWPRVALLGAAALVLVWLIVVPYYDNEEVHEVRAGFPASEPREKTESQPTTPASQAPTAPVLVSSGGLEGTDHDATGTVNLYREADGGYVIQFLGIDIESTPDPIVYVVNGADREDTDGGADLGGLRANQGDLFYDVPADLDPTQGDWTVLVWCRAFGVPIANATLTA